MKNGLKKIGLLRTALYSAFLVLVSFIMVGEPTAKPIKLVFSSHDPAGGSWAYIYEPWFEEIERFTDGNVVIEPHWGGELAGFFEAYNAAADGIVDIAHIMPTMYPKQLPLEQVLNLTSYNVTRNGASQMYWELHQETPAMQAAYKKTKVLTKLVTFPNFFCTIKGRKAHRFEDFKGMKFITVGKWDTALYKAFNMVPATVGPTETFMSFQTGIIDGGVFTFPALYDFGIAEVLPNLIMNNARPGVWALVMNAESWNKIPKKYQDVILEVSEALPQRQDRAQLELYRDLQMKMKKEFPQTEIIELSQSELDKFSKAAQSVREQFVKELNDEGLPGTELMETFLRLEKKYSSKLYGL